MEPSAIDIESSCRMCLQPSDRLESLFETFYENSQLSKLLTKMNVEIRIEQHDQLSSLICGDCQMNAINAYKFHQMCSSNDRKIRELLANQTDFIDDVKTEAEAEVLRDGLSPTTKIEPAYDESLPDNSTNALLLQENQSVDDEYGSESPEGDDDSDSEESSDGDEKREQLSCDSCDKSFSSSRKLENHIMNIHQSRKSTSVASEDESSDGDDESEKIFTCDACPKKFKKPSLLARHIKTHDPNKRPHECEKCQKRFPSRSALVRHDVLHSDLEERSRITRSEAQDFICVICSRSFKSPETLTSHLKTHKSKTADDQEHTCKLCNDSFPTYTDIIRHSKNHIENATHQCATCNKLFVIGDELIDHFLRHKGLKPHRCPVCDKSFLKVHKLNVHMRIHSDDKVRRDSGVD